MTTAGAVVARPGRRVLAAMQGLPGWILIAVIAAATLAIGSVHPASSSAAARISRLDSIIKCPSCDNLSIAESNAATARTLRAVVAADVRAGESDAEIESYVVSRYGAAILLSPTNSVVWIVPIVVLVVSAGGLALFLVRRGRLSAAAGDRRGPVTDNDAELVEAALAAREAARPGG